MFPGIAESGFPIIAGPCAIESSQQFDRIAAQLAARGIRYIRGGAYKPRTDPKSFRGLGRRGLEAMASVGRSRGLKIVSEILDVRDLDAFAAAVDVVVIGARSMRNHVLIEETAHLPKPLILKRDFSAPVEEWVNAAEYALLAGNNQVVLCERGVRWCDPKFRNLLDLAAVAWLRENTEYRVLVDPSHATGDPRLIPRVSKAALACGADGLMIEVHDRPEEALCDGQQALTIEALDGLLTSLSE